MCTILRTSTSVHSSLWQRVNFIHLYQIILIMHRVTMTICQVATYLQSIQVKMWVGLLEVISNQMNFKTHGCEKGIKRALPSNQLGVQIERRGSSSTLSISNIERISVWYLTQMFRPNMQFGDSKISWEPNQIYCGNSRAPCSVATQNLYRRI